MQLPEIRTRVRALSNIRSSALLSDAEIDEYVNEFNRSIIEQYDWPQFVASSTLTGTGSATFALPADCRNLIAVAVEYDTDLRPIRAVASRDLSNFNLSTVAIPEVYVEDPLAKSMRVAPTPAAGTKIVVTFHKNPTTLTGASAPPFDSEYHVAWAYAGAVSALRERGGDERRIAELQGRLSEVIARMRRRYLMTRDREAIQLPRRW